MGVINHLMSIKKKKNLQNLSYKIKYKACIQAKESLWERRKKLMNFIFISKENMEIIYHFDFRKI